MSRVQLALLVGGAITVAVAVAEIAAAGPVGGNKRFAGTIRPGTEAHYSFSLRGDEPFSIRVAGDGAADIDCFLLDENDTVVDGDDDSTSTCVIEGEPKWTGPFTLVVQNVGEQSTFVIGVVTGQGTRI